MVTRVRKSGDGKKTKKRKEGEWDEGGKKEEREIELERRRNGHLALYKECRLDFPRYRESSRTLRE